MEGNTDGALLSLSKTETFEDAKHVLGEAAAGEGGRQQPVDGAEVWGVNPPDGQDYHHSQGCVRAGVRHVSAGRMVWQWVNVRGAVLGGLI